MASGIKGHVEISTLVDTDCVSVAYKKGKKIVAYGEGEGVDNNAVIEALRNAIYYCIIQYNN